MFELSFKVLIYPNQIACIALIEKCLKAFSIIIMLIRILIKAIIKGNLCINLWKLELELRSETI